MNKFKCVVAYATWEYILIDEELNWKNQVEQVCNSIKCLFPTFYNIRQYLSIEQVKIIYYALVYSRIKYGLVVYGSALQNVISPIQTLQNQLLKVLTNKPYRFPTNQLHNELDILKVEDIFKQDLLTFIFNHHTGNLPMIFKNYFTSFDEIHNYNTRNSETNCRLPLPSNSFGSSSIKFLGAPLWNRLDNNVKSSKTTKCFRKNIKKEYLPYTIE